MKPKNKLLIVVGVVVALMIGCVAFSNLDQRSDDIVILYTNDVHTYIDKPLSYDNIAVIKNQLEEDYKYVYLVDAGDHVQGTGYGSMDQGESIVKMMNASEYDFATLGNHEFDYGMDGCMNVIDLAQYQYLSCNFYHEKNNERQNHVLKPYVVLDCGDESLAFIGITTPETFAKSTPKYFQNDKGEFIYGIAAGDDGSDLYHDVQEAIDGAKKEGATQIIAIGHLGIDSSSTPWTSEETIANITGLDAFIDGHSHHVMEGEEIFDKEGNSVILTQTGEYFERIGMMVIDANTDEITTDFIELAGDEETGYTLFSDLYHGKELLGDDKVATIKNEWLNEIDTILGEEIGTFDISLENYDVNGTRLVRSEETNAGDFAADAIYYLFDSMDLDVDVAFMNGGGIRNESLTGEISYKTCKDVHPFGNVACLQKVSGQQILDMLEWGARFVGAGENGAFLQTSGLTYKINPSIPSTIKADDKEGWIEGPQTYRVYDVKIYNKETNTWDVLDLQQEYHLAGYNYTLRDLGDGFTMLKDAENVLDYVMEDYMVLATYIQAFENTKVTAKNSPLLKKYPNLLIDYGNPQGSGRINIMK